MKRAWSLPQHITSDAAYTAIRTLEKLRVYLRDQYPTQEHKILSQLQDILDGQKARRYLRKRAYTQFIWEFAGEAFWIFIETAQGMQVEEFLATLPESLQKEMELLGFVELERSRIEALCDAGEEFLNRVALILRRPSG